MFLFYLLCYKYAGVGFFVVCLEGFFSFFFLSVKSFVSEDDLHLLGFFFPVNISGAKFSDFCSVWKCATALIFDNRAVVFGILNDSREYFWLFLWCNFFLFSLPTC